MDFNIPYVVKISLLWVLIVFNIVAGHLVRILSHAIPIDFLTLNFQSYFPALFSIFCFLMLLSICLQITLLIDVINENQIIYWRSFPSCIFYAHKIFSASWRVRISLSQFTSSLQFFPYKNNLDRISICGNEDKPFLDPVVTGDEKYTGTRQLSFHYLNPW